MESLIEFYLNKQNNNPLSPKEDLILQEVILLHIENLKNKSSATNSTKDH